MSFQQGDEVVVNEKRPYLFEQSGVVTDPNDDGYVVVRMYNNDHLNCFLPEELQPEEAGETAC